MFIPIWFVIIIILFIPGVFRAVAAVVGVTLMLSAFVAFWALVIWGLHAGLS